MNAPEILIYLFAQVLTGHDILQHSHFLRCTHIAWTHKCCSSWIGQSIYRSWASPSAPYTLWTSVQSSPWLGRKSWSIQWFLVLSIRCWASCNARNPLIDENRRQKERRRCVALHLSRINIFPDIDLGFDFIKVFTAGFDDDFSKKFLPMVLAQISFQRNL